MFAKCDLKLSHSEDPVRMMILWIWMILFTVLVLVASPRKSRLPLNLPTLARFYLRFSTLHTQMALLHTSKWSWSTLFIISLLVHLDVLHVCCVYHWSDSPNHALYYNLRAACHDCMLTIGWRIGLPGILFAYFAFTRNILAVTAEIHSKPVWRPLMSLCVIWYPT